MSPVLEPGNGPIVSLRKQLEDAGMLDEAGFAGMEARVEREVAAAVSFAEAGTWEAVEDLARDVYSPGGAS